MPFNSGYRAKRANDTQGIIGPQSQFLQKTFPKPYITGYAVSGSDDTALDPAGGQTVLINGGNFASGVSAVVDGTQIGSVTLVNSNQISFTSPAKTSGSYTLIVYNPSSDSAAILVPGLIYSGVPTWTTAAGSIGSVYETKAINTSVVATSDSALTYAITSGSIPTGATFYANGVMTGTAPVDSGSTTYTFAVTATDAELQDTTRTFTLTVNTDVVTWVNPSNGASILLDGSAYSTELSATDAAGYSVSYAANALPTGLTLSGGTISGTPTVIGDTTTLLTATAATTGRTSTNTITWTVSFGDIYWDYVTTLLSANTSPSFIKDASINNTVLTPAGTIRADNSNPYQLGYYSDYMNGQVYSALGAAGAVFSLTGDFTIEAWIFPTSFPGGDWGVLDVRASGGTATPWVFGTQGGTNKMYFYDGTARAGTTVLTPNKWYHMVWVRTGSTLKAYLNGVLDYYNASYTTAAVGPTSTSPYIGTKDYGIANFGTYGYISNLRVVNGTAMYNTTATTVGTSAFTSPTAPLTAVNNTVLLTCQSARFVDNSPTALTVTPSSSTLIATKTASPFATVYQAGTQYYSNYFDGSDRLTRAWSSEFDLGNTYTIELWAYSATASGWKTLFNIEFPLVDYFGVMAISLRGDTGKLEFSMQQATGSGYQSSAAHLNALSTFVKNKWYHIAVSVNAGTGTLYIDGVAQATAAIPLFIGTPAGIGIGGHYNGYNSSTEAWPGQISNLRIVKGTALYASNFIPSATPLTAVSGTVLLTCQDNTIKDNSTNNFALTVVGDAKPTTAHPYMFDPTYYSTSFDGTGDYLTVPANAALTLGTSDYTVEAWVNLTGTQTTTYGWGVIGTYPGSGSGWSITINRSSGGQGIIWILGSSIVASYTTAYIPVNTWTHIAVTRSGTGTNNTKMFLNGVLVNQVTDNTNDTFSGLTYIGGQGTGQLLTGYVSNARVVKGTAVYTANFTPSTSPLTAISGTSLLTCQDSLIIDRSSNVFAITANGNAAPAAVAPFTQPSSYTSNQITTFGSGYFDGSGSYLTTPGSSAFNLGSSTSTPWTVECWVYQFSSKTTNLVSQGAAVWRINLNTNGTVNWLFNTSSVQTSTDAIVYNAWNHIAVTYDGLYTGTSNKIFVNGKLQSNMGQLIPPNDSSTTLYVGRNVDGGTAWDMNGYISDVRVVKGTALYTSNFVPSVNSQLTNVTNTQLLTLQNNNNANNSGFKDSSSFNNLITRAGNTTQGTFSPYGENWSNYFDGTGDYLSFGAVTSPTTGDFTVEFWFYNTRSAWTTSFDITDGGSGAMALYISSAGDLRIAPQNQSTTLIASILSLPLNTWNHFAVIRSSGSLRAYANGNALAAAISYTTSMTGFTKLFGTADGYALGYVSNFRYTTNAVYSIAGSTISVPTTPLTAIASTGLLTCQSPNIVDNSPNNLTLTKNGDVSVQKFGPFAGTTLPTPYYSGYFDGSGDYLSGTANAAYNFGTGDFTIEFWVYPTAAFSTTRMFSTYTNGIAIFPTNTGTIQVDAYGVGAKATTTSTVSINTWTHIAVVRVSGTTKIYLNGVLGGSGTDSTNYSSSGLYIGTDNGTNTYTGYISNVRIVKGTALYASNFTPPTSPLTAVSGTSLLTCQNNTFIDNSTNNFTITAAGNATPRQISPFTPTYSTGQSYTPAVYGGSMYFDGTGDYLSSAYVAGIYDIPQNTPVTFECWVYTSSTNPFILANRNWGWGGGGPTWGFVLNSGVTPRWAIAGTGSATYIMAESSISGVLGQWNHYAFTRDSSNVVRIFVNGVVGVTRTDGQAMTSTSGGVFFGAPTNTAAYSTGYASDVRLIIGTAVYTSNFVPQNQPLTPVRNTTLLLSGTGGGIYDASEIVDYETVGDAKLANFSPYNGSYYSNYFDGSGDYLTLPAAAGNFSGAFTVEFWFNASSVSSGYFVSTYLNATTGWSIGFPSSGVIGAWLTGDGADITGATSVSTGTWNHVALSGQSGSVKLFLNGVQQGSTFTGSISVSSGVAVTVGYLATALVTPYTGYISNLRIVNGTALYTTNFTPPTSPLTAISGTSLLTCQSNKFVDNSTNNFTITRNGDVAVRTQNPWQNNTGTSVYFDGTGDYLTTPSINFQNFAFNTGNFTMEAWIYPTVFSGDKVIISSFATWATSVNFFFGTRAGTPNVLIFRAGDSLPISLIGNTALNANEWAHVAVSRSSGTTRIFVNGVAQTATHTGTVNISTTVRPVVIGSDDAGAPAELFVGNISDLRVTKGVARYTTNFTPPTSPLPNK